MHFKPVTHVIFDMDGLIIESESIYKKILQQIAKEYGKKYTEEIEGKVLGTTEKDTAKIFLHDLDIPLSVDEFLDIYHKKVKEQLQNPSLMPGAERLIVHLSKHNVPIAVATSSSQEALLVKTKNHQNIFKLFHHIVCGSTDPEVKNGKPAPDIFLVCASRFPEKVDPEKCLVLEDAPNGIKGAISAGMQGVLVPAKNVGEGQRKLATLVIESLEEFRPEFFGLPPFEN
ncbi:pseudouridine-5'-phosphatase-like [Anthonomus grandis grandis]|uniref:pseudouridine-5'-phosphatase-like n=1 Tax=Anthonomus grandis grandis TaxID=2921223 RepID=UPI002166828D|nr:pseudouridine-5'-phosphatase-like [Anthonomus grandis grandis]